MARKFKTAVLFSAAALLAGCSGSTAHEEPEKLLYEGTAAKVEYDLGEGKTVVIDDKGVRHDVAGYPMMFKGKIKLSGEDEHYRIEILSLADSSAPAQPAAEQPAAPASEYE